MVQGVGAELKLNDSSLGSSALHKRLTPGLRYLSGLIQLGVSENRGPSYSTLNSRILIIWTPK